MFRSAWYLLCTILLIGACRKGDTIPAYVQINGVQLVTSTSPVDQGSASHNITDLWVFVDDEAYGVWELPAKVPLIKAGPTTLKFIAGVQNNGIGTEHVQYPFYATSSITADLNLEGTVLVDPVFNYFSNLDFWLEAFEDPGIKFQYAASSDTIIERITAPDTVFEGSATGAIFLDDDRPYFKCQTNEQFVVPSNSGTYLEMNYRSDTRMLIGTSVAISGTTVETPFLYVSPTKLSDGTMPWKKIYIELSPVISAPGWTNKEFFIEVTKNAGSATGVVFLDNIKLIHRSI